MWIKKNEREMSTCLGDERMEAVEMALAEAM